MNSLSEAEFKELVDGEDLTIIDFSASWCMPCRMLAPILEQVANKMTNVSFYALDIDENEEIAKRYRIFSVPTLLAFKKGEVIDNLVGLNSFDEVLNFVKTCEMVEIDDD